MTLKPKGTHGGPGRGGGRHPMGKEPKRRCTVTLDQQIVEWAREIGSGNLSGGLERAVRLAAAVSIHAYTGEEDPP